MDWSGVLTELIKAALLAVVPVIGLLLGKLLKKGIDRIENQSLQGFAWTAVRFAEDKLVGPNKGAEKFRLASQWLRDKFPKLDQAAVEAAIRAAYQQFSAELGNAAGSPSTP